LRNGAIAESGSFAELMRKGGVFAELYNSQFFDAPNSNPIQAETSPQPS
jgi:hypothetical protein